MDTSYRQPESILEKSFADSAGKRPASFEPGREYSWLYEGGSPGASPRKKVKFIQYDNCPAFVIVLDTTGKIIRCPRDELFLI